MCSIFFASIIINNFASNPRATWPLCSLPCKQNDGVNSGEIFKSLKSAGVSFVWSRKNGSHDEGTRMYLSPGHMSVVPVIYISIY